MKKFLWSIGCFLTTFLVLLFFFGNKNTDENKSVQAKKQQYDEIEDSNKNVTFVVAEYDGNVAVFEKDNPSPLKITDVQIIDLPAEDKKLLKKGIEVRTKEELSNILEDYCS